MPALVLGIVGLKRRQANPAIKGTAHAWIGIGCGGVMALVWGAAFVMIIVAMIANG